jgi:hypothetical protein
VNRKAGASLIEQAKDRERVVEALFRLLALPKGFTSINGSDSGGNQQPNALKAFEQMRTHFSEQNVRVFTFSHV